MRKPVFPRIIFLAFLYCIVFAALVVLQFTKRGGFTQRIGNFVVSGQYRLPEENEQSGGPNEYFLDGDAHVFFGGMDFCLAQENDGHSLLFTGADGTKEGMRPERMLINGDSALFSFPGGVRLEFTTQYAGGSLEMSISGVFPEDVSGADLPFKPQRRTGTRETSDGHFIVSADGVDYSFGRSPVDAGAGMILVRAGEAPISYRAIPERKTFSPGDFILPQAKTAEAYGEALARWRDQNFSLWNRTVSGQPNEDLVIALESEALVRGTYKAAVAAVPPAFLRGSGRTHESSVYLGGLDQAYRLLIAREREKLARLSRQINEKSLEFLKEPRVFEYLAVRGHLNLFDAGADLIHTIDPAILALDIVPGILEGYMDWKIVRPAMDNPFERLVDQACFVISESLRIFDDPEAPAGRTAEGEGSPLEGSKIFSFQDGQGDTEFNLRLGKALLVYAEDARDSDWAGIGRSIILSALSMGDSSGAVGQGLVLSETGEIAENPASPALTTARLYRILRPGDYYPRAAAIGASVNGIWTWTAAQRISASQENNVLDIAVTFLAGESHYMIIRGIRPFTKIQLYEMDFRTDPQFERYDSSGWGYNAQEQTLILKMKHRTPVEHIRLFY